MGSQNRKGIFARPRQPKAAAFIVPTRYEPLESVPAVPSKTF